MNYIPNRASVTRVSDIDIAEIDKMFLEFMKDMDSKGAIRGLSCTVYYDEDEDQFVISFTAKIK